MTDLEKVKLNKYLRSKLSYGQVILGDESEATIISIFEKSSDEIQICALETDLFGHVISVLAFLLHELIWIEDTKEPENSHWTLRKDFADQNILELEYNEINKENVQ